MIINLYHGTSEANYREIRSLGVLSSPFLTSDDEHAQYYAECAAEEDFSQEVILVVSIDTESLCADIQTYNEPLSYILKSYNLTERDWHTKIKEGVIDIPEINQWHISLEKVKCVMANSDISIKDIIYDGSLNEKDEADILEAINLKYINEKRIVEYRP